MKKVSILIPVFQADAYLSECIDSVLNQTYENIELILCDDGSDDRSAQICRQYAEKDARVRFYAQEHGGVIAARNRLLSYASGEYLFFVDSDDRIEQTLVESAVRAMTDGTDMVVWGMDHILLDGRIEQILFRSGVWDLRSGVFQSRFIVGDFLNYRLGWELSNRMFRTDLIRKLGLRLEEDSLYYEDYLFTFHYVMHCREIRSFGNRVLYHYIQRSGSLTEEWRRESAGKWYARLVRVAQFLFEACAESEFPEVRNVAFLAAWECLEWHTRELISEYGAEKCREIMLSSMDTQMRSRLAHFESGYASVMEQYGEVCGLVTVTVPIYNIAGYVEKCIDTIRSQTYGKLQILLVDDGSSDASPLICDRAAQQDFRISVIHKENGGLSSARNAGIERACGEYMVFVDGDDYIRPELVEMTVMAIEKNCADMCVFKALRVTGDREELFGFEYEYGVLNTPDNTSKYDFITNHLLKYEYGWEAWSRMYRTSIIRGNELRFVSERKVFAEDMLFALCCSSCIDTTMMIPERLYYYMEREGSLMDEKNRRMQFREFANLLEEYYRFLEKKDPESYILQNYHVIYHAVMKRHYDWMKCLYGAGERYRSMKKAACDRFSKEQIRSVLKHWDELEQSGSKVVRMVDRNLLRSLASGFEPLYFGVLAIGKLYNKIKGRKIWL